jgi:hypothetical protein
MTFSRRDFLVASIGMVATASHWKSDVAGFGLADPGRIINRRSLVERHSPTLHQLDPLAPLSLGNGEFAFTADITGLQTFPSEYEQSMPLCTMSQWGWHTEPVPTGVDPKQFRLTQYDTHGRPVGYATSSEGQREVYDWLRENPHRLHLGRIGLLLLKGDEAAAAADISEVRQRLDLWSGSLHSRFKVAGTEVYVRTAVDPELDLLAVSIESSLIRERRLAVRLAFPYGSPEMQAADWRRPQQHRTTLMNMKWRSNGSVRLNLKVTSYTHFC